VKRTVLVLECATVLLLCAGGTGLIHLWKTGPLTFQIASTGLLVPAFTTILFLCVSLGIPDLYAVGRIRFPLNVTLPILYTAMLLLSMTLLSRVGLSISRVPDSYSAINIWSSWWVLFSTFLAGSIFLTVLSLFERPQGGAVDS
jgi:hypothetical protein